MNHRIWFRLSLIVIVSTTLALISGCDKEQSKSEEQSKPEEQKIVEKKVVQKITEQKPEKPKVATEPKKVKLETSMGDIVIELNQEAAPVTVKNFLGYVEESFFDGTIFHRVIPNFMIQGGGFTADMERKETHAPIVNEASNGLKNSRGTVAMARTNNPDSATSQFFINHKDNGPLNYAGPDKPGYTVFGKVVQGMDVVDKIAAVKTTRNRKGRFADVPVEPVVIKSVRVVLRK